jgi:hypothetical protein
VAELSFIPVTKLIVFRFNAGELDTDTEVAPAVGVASLTADGARFEVLVAFTTRRFPTFCAARAFPAAISDVTRTICSTGVV